MRPLVEQVDGAQRGQAATCGRGDAGDADVARGPAATSATRVLSDLQHALFWSSAATAADCNAMLPTFC